MGDKNMKLLAFILNIPWTLMGLFYGLVSLPKKVKFDKDLFTVIVNVKRLWLSEIFLRRRVSGFTAGNTVLLSDLADDFTYGHEILHIDQFKRIPLIFPGLYCIELMRRGYYENKYEKEARQKSNKSV